MRKVLDAVTSVEWIFLTFLGVAVGSSYRWLLTRGRDLLGRSSSRWRARNEALAASDAATVHRSETAIPGSRQVVKRQSYRIGPVPTSGRYVVIGHLGEVVDPSHELDHLQATGDQEAARRRKVVETGQRCPPGRLAREPRRDVHLCQTVADFVP